MLTKEKPSSLLNNILEKGDPLTEAPLAYEISVLQFVSQSEKASFETQSLTFYSLCSALVSSTPLFLFLVSSSDCLGSALASSLSPSSISA